MKTCNHLLVLFFCSFIFTSKPSYSFELTSLVNVDPGCLNLVVGGYCPFTDKLVVSHYYPIALIEVLNGPGEMILKEPSNFKFGARHNNDIFKSWEVRIWDIKKLITKVSAVGCMLCDPDKSISNDDIGSSGGGGSGGGSSDGGGFGSLGSDLGSFTEGMKTEGSSGGSSGGSSDEDSPSLSATETSCGPSPKSIKRVIDAYNRGMSFTGVKLVYTTEFDFIHWRSGCRDIKNTANVKAPLQCLKTAVSSDSDAVFNTNLSSKYGSKECVGTWGPIKPRQFSLVNTDIAGAAMTAYRAMDLAKKVIKTMPFYFGPRGKFQHVYPRTAGCFSPGANPMKLSLQTTASFNGQYAFIWWIRITCCKGLSDISECYSNMASQQSGTGTDFQSGTGGGGLSSP